MLLFRLVASDACIRSLFHSSLGDCIVADPSLSGFRRANTQKTLQKLKPSRPSDACVFLHEAFNCIIDETALRFYLGSCGRPGAVSHWMAAPAAERRN